MPSINVDVGANISLNQSSVRRVRSDAKSLLRDVTGGRGGVNFNVNSKSFTQPLGQITNASNEFSKSLEASNARVLAFGASVAIINAVQGAFRSLVETSIDLQKTLTDINVVLGLSLEGIENFGTKLFGVAKNTAQSFGVAAEAALEFSRQGLSVEETLRRTNDALTLTRLTGLDASESVSGLTAAINGLGDAALTTTDIIDKFAAVDVKFAVSAEDLVRALARTGAVASDVGLDIDKLSGMVAALQQTTARGGPVIGNALKTIFTRLQRPATISSLEDMGVVTRDLSGTLLSADSILTNLSKSFDGLSQSQQSNTVQMVAGIFQANILRALLKDLKKDQSLFAQATEVASEANGEAAKKTEQLNKTLAALGSQTLTSFQALAKTIGDIALAPGIKDILSGLKSVSETFNDLFGGGENQGNDFAKGLLKGIGNILTGPGLAVLAAVFGKLIYNVTRFAASGVQDILGIVSAKEKQKAVEQSILTLLQTNKGVTESLNKLEQSRGEQEKYILGLIKMQTSALREQEALARAVAPGLVRKGVQSDLIIKRGGRTASGGLVPEENAALGLMPAQKERIGAFKGGYSPGAVSTMDVKGMGTVVYNKAETVKKFPNFSQPAIMPPEKSRAGKNYKEKFSSTHGFNPYANDGLVPNFGLRPNRQLLNSIPNMKLLTSPLGYSKFNSDTDFAKKTLAISELERMRYGGKQARSRYAHQEGTLKFDTDVEHLRGGIFTTRIRDSLGREKELSLGKLLEKAGIKSVRTELELGRIPYAEATNTPLDKKLPEDITKVLANTKNSNNDRKGELGEASYLKVFGAKDKNGNLIKDGDQFAETAIAGYVGTTKNSRVDAIMKGAKSAEIKAGGASLTDVAQKGMSLYSNRGFINEIMNVGGREIQRGTHHGMPQVAERGKQIMYVAEQMRLKNMKNSLLELHKLKMWPARDGSHEANIRYKYAKDLAGGDKLGSAIMQGRFKVTDADRKMLDDYSLHDGLVPNASAGFIPRYNPDAFDNDRTYQFMQNKHKEVTRPFFERLRAGEAYGSTDARINDSLMKSGEGSPAEGTFKSTERGERKIDAPRALSFFEKSAKKIGPVAAAQFMIDHEMMTDREAQKAIQDLRGEAARRSEGGTQSKMPIVKHLDEVEKNAGKLKFFEKQYPEDAAKFMRGVVTGESETRKGYKKILPKKSGPQIGTDRIRSRRMSLHNLIRNKTKSPHGEYKNLSDFRNQTGAFASSNTSSTESVLREERARRTREAYMQKMQKDEGSTSNRKYNSVTGQFGANIGTKTRKALVSEIGMVPGPGYKTINRQAEKSKELNIGGNSSVKSVLQERTRYNPETFKQEKLGTDRVLSVGGLYSRGGESGALVLKRLLKEITSAARSGQPYTAIDAGPVIGPRIPSVIIKAKTVLDRIREKEAKKANTGMAHTNIPHMRLQGFLTPRKLFKGLASRRRENITEGGTIKRDQRSHSQYQFGEEGVLKDSLKNLFKSSSGKYLGRRGEETSLRKFLKSQDIRYLEKSVYGEGGFSSGLIPNFSEYIFDADRIAGKEKNPILNAILESDSRIKKDLIIGPSGAGKTEYAKTLGNPFINSVDDIAKATQITMLSGAGRAKDESMMSAGLQKIISSVNNSGGNINFLEAGDDQIKNQRHGRIAKAMEGAAGSSDLRSVGQLKGTGYAPLNQLDFMSKIKKVAGSFSVIKNLGAGKGFLKNQIPNFARGFGFMPEDVKSKIRMGRALNLEKRNRALEGRDPKLFDQHYPHPFLNRGSKERLDFHRAKGDGHNEQIMESKLNFKNFEISGAIRRDANKGLISEEEKIRYSNLLKDSKNPNGELINLDKKYIGGTSLGGMSETDKLQKLSRYQMQLSNLQKTKKDLKSLDFKDGYDDFEYAAKLRNSIVNQESILPKGPALKELKSYQKLKNTYSQYLDRTRYLDSDTRLSIGAVRKFGRNPHEKVINDLTGTHLGSKGGIARSIGAKDGDEVFDYLTYQTKKELLEGKGVGHVLRDNNRKRYLSDGLVPNFGILSNLTKRFKTFPQQSSQIHAYKKEQDLKNNPNFRMGMAKEMYNSMSNPRRQIRNNLPDSLSIKNWIKKNREFHGSNMGIKSGVVQAEGLAKKDIAKNQIEKTKHETSLRLGAARRVALSGPALPTIGEKIAGAEKKSLARRIWKGSEQEGWQSLEKRRQKVSAGPGVGHMYSILPKEKGYNAPFEPNTMLKFKGNEGHDIESRYRTRGRNASYKEPARHGTVYDKVLEVGEIASTKQGQSVYKRIINEILASAKSGRPYTVLDAGHIVGERIPSAIVGLKKILDRRREKSEFFIPKIRLEGEMNSPEFLERKIKMNNAPEGGLFGKQGQKFKNALDTLDPTGQRISHTNNVRLESLKFELNEGFVPNFAKLSALRGKLFNKKQKKDEGLRFNTTKEGFRIPHQPKEMSPFNARLRDEESRSMLRDRGAFWSKYAKISTGERQKSAAARSEDLILRSGSARDLSPGNAALRARETSEFFSKRMGFWKDYKKTAKASGSPHIQKHIDHLEKRVGNFSHGGMIPNFAGKWKSRRMASQQSIDQGVIFKNKDYEQSMVRSGGLATTHLQVASMRRNLGLPQNMSQWTLKDHFKYAKEIIKTQTFRAALGLTKKIGNDTDPSRPGIGDMFFQSGLVPNFAGALSDAISREKAAGVPASSIRLDQSDQLKSPQNPNGLAVINTRDEPRGVNQGIQRAKAMGIDPKTHGANNGLVPNFAPGSVRNIQPKAGFEFQKGGLFGNKVVMNSQGQPNIRPVQPTQDPMMKMFMFTSAISMGAGMMQQFTAGGDEASKKMQEIVKGISSAAMGLAVVAPMSMMLGQSAGMLGKASGKLIKYAGGIGIALLALMPMLKAAFPEGMKALQSTASTTKETLEELSKSGQGAARALEIIQGRQELSKSLSTVSTKENKSFQDIEAMQKMQFKLIESVAAEATALSDISSKKELSLDFNALINEGKTQTEALKELVMISSRAQAVTSSTAGIQRLMNTLGNDGIKTGVEALGFEGDVDFKDLSKDNKKIVTDNIKAFGSIVATTMDKSTSDQLANIFGGVREDFEKDNTAVGNIENFKKITAEMRKNAGNPGYFDQDSMEILLGISNAETGRRIGLGTKGESQSQAKKIMMLEEMAKTYDAETNTVALLPNAVGRTNNGFQDTISRADRGILPKILAPLGLADAMFGSDELGRLDLNDPTVTIDRMRSGFTDRATKNKKKPIDGVNQVSFKLKKVGDKKELADKEVTELTGEILGMTGLSLTLKQSFVEMVKANQQSPGNLVKLGDAIAESTAAQENLKNFSKKVAQLNREGLNEFNKIKNAAKLRRQTLQEQRKISSLTLSVDNKILSLKNENLKSIGLLSKEQNIQDKYESKLDTLNDDFLNKIKTSREELLGSIQADFTKKLEQGIDAPLFQRESTFKVKDKEGKDVTKKLSLREAMADLTPDGETFKVDSKALNAKLLAELDILTGEMGSVARTGKPLTAKEFMDMPEEEIKKTSFVFKTMPNQDGVSTLQTELEKQLNDAVKSNERIDAGSLRNSVLKAFNTEENPQEQVKSFLFAAEKGLIPAEPRELQDAQAALKSQESSEKFLQETLKEKKRSLKEESDSANFQGKTNKGLKRLNDLIVESGGIRGIIKREQDKIFSETTAEFRFNQAYNAVLKAQVETRLKSLRNDEAIAANADTALITGVEKTREQKIVAERRLKFMGTDLGQVQNKDMVSTEITSQESSARLAADRLNYLASNQGEEIRLRNAILEESRSELATKIRSNQILLDNENFIKESRLEGLGQFIDRSQTGVMDLGKRRENLGRFSNADAGMGMTSSIMDLAETADLATKRARISSSVDFGPGRKMPAPNEGGFSLNPIKVFQKGLATQGSSENRNQDKSILEAVRAQNELAKEYNTFAPVVDTLREKIAESALNVSTFSERLTAISFDGVRTGLVSLIKDLGDASKSSSDSWKGFARGLATTIGDALIQRNVDLVLSSLAPLFGADLRGIEERNLSINQSIKSEITSGLGSAGAIASSLASLNASFTALAQTMSGASPAGLYRGGPISGEVGRDKIPAMLTSGEYVINADSSRKIGRSALDSMNQNAEIPAEVLSRSTVNRTLSIKEHDPFKDDISDNKELKTQNYDNGGNVSSSDRQWAETYIRKQGGKGRGFLNQGLPTLLGTAVGTNTYRKNSNNQGKIEKEEEFNNSRLKSLNTKSVIDSKKLTGRGIAENRVQKEYGSFLLRKAERRVQKENQKFMEEASEAQGWKMAVASFVGAEIVSAGISYATNKVGKVLKDMHTSSGHESYSGKGGELDRKDYQKKLKTGRIENPETGTITDAALIQRSTFSGKEINNLKESIAKRNYTGMNPDNIKIDKKAYSQAREAGGSAFSVPYSTPFGNGETWVHRGSRFNLANQAQLPFPNDFKNPSGFTFNRIGEFQLTARKENQGGLIKNIEKRILSSQSEKNKIIEEGIKNVANIENESNSKTTRRSIITSMLSSIKNFEYEFKNKGGSIGGGVPAMLTDGEYVFDKKSASGIGARFLETINRYNKGGFISGEKGVDNVGPFMLEEGSFVINAKATKKMEEDSPGIMSMLSSKPNIAKSMIAGFNQGGAVGNVGTAEGKGATVVNETPSNSKKINSTAVQGGDSTNNINISINIDKSGNESESKSISVEAEYKENQEMTNRIKDAVLNVIRQEKRVGGELY